MAAARPPARTDAGGRTDGRTAAHCWRIVGPGFGFVTALDQAGQLSERKRNWPGELIESGPLCDLAARCIRWPGRSSAAWPVLRVGSWAAPALIVGARYQPGRSLWLRLAVCPPGLALVAWSICARSWLPAVCLWLLACLDA